MLTPARPPLLDGDRVLFSKDMTITIQRNSIIVPVEKITFVIPEFIHGGKYAIRSMIFSNFGRKEFRLITSHSSAFWILTYAGVGKYSSHIKALFSVKYQ